MTTQPTETAEEAAHYAHICKSYLVSAAVVRREFPNADGFANNQTEYVVHPIAQLLGIALETGLKGNLLIQRKEIKFTHDLELLFGQVADEQIKSRIEHALKDLPIPELLRLENKDTPIDDLENFYRGHHLHLSSLNSVYNRPFISRYPSKKSFLMPDADALLLITNVILDVLNEKIASSISST